MTLCDSANLSGSAEDASHFKDHFKLAIFPFLDDDDDDYYYYLLLCILN